MKKIWKRLSAAVIAFAVLLTAVVFEVPGNLVAAADTSGTCGTSATWTYDAGTNTLTISGTGNMNNWSDASYVPWYSNRAAIENVVIESGITNIGNNAFSKLSKLSTVTIKPGSVITSIGQNAFNQSSINSIEIPEGVTTIGYNAFYGCSSLSSINIPAAVMSIGESAFSSCTLLTTINVADGNSYLLSEGGVLFNKDKTKLICCPGGKLGSYEIPNSVDTIRKRAFSGCQLTSISIQDSVTSIEDSAFSGCKSLTSIEIPSSVTSIGTDVFSGCSSLKSTTILSNVNSIKTGMFNGCSSLTSIEMPSSVTSIGSSAFLNCTGLTSITIPENVTSIKSSAFSSCTGLTSVTIPEAVTSIEARAFNGCTNLVEIIYPSSVTTIGSNAIPTTTIQLIYGSVESDGKLNVTSIDLKSSGKTSITITNDMKINSVAPDYWDIVADEGHDHIYSGANCRICGLINDSCGEGAKWSYDEDTQKLTICGTGAMTDWTSESDVPWADKKGDIQNVVIEDGITSIGNNAFNGCTSLETVEFKGSTPPTTVGTDAFKDCTALKTIVVPENSLSAYNSNNSLSSLGASIVDTTGKGSCGNSAFYTYNEGTKTLNISGSGAMTNLENADAVPWAANKADIKKVVIGDEITSVGKYAFYGCTGLTSVTIPSSVETIGDSAFNGCNKLAEATFERTTPPNIGANAFNGCTKLTKVIVPDDALNAYSQVSALSGLNILDSTGTKGTCGAGATWELADGTLTISGSGAMTDWNSEDDVPWATYQQDITSVVIADGITSIGNNAFNGFTGLTEITIPANVAKIGDNAFAGCTTLATVKFESSTPPNTISTNAFDNCDTLEKIVVPVGSLSAYSNSLSSLDASIEDTEGKSSCGENATWAYDAETHTLTISGTGAMTNWTSELDVPWKDKRGDIQNVVIENGITSIGKNAFYGCTNLSSANIANSVKTIGDSAFDGCTNLVLTALPAGVTSVGQWAFQDCDGLTEISIPSGATCENGAFYRCSELAKVTIAEGVTSIGNSVFSGCSKLTSVTIPSSVTSIGTGAFGSCEKLTSITIPSSVNSVGDRVFEDCSELATVTFKKKTTPPTIGKDVFSGCTKLTEIVVPADSKEAYEAETNLADQNSIIVEAAPENACGDDATWAYNDTTKTLTISGTGDMSNWTSEDPAPWSDKEASIENVVIADGITAVGDNAFKGCTKITAVTIPANVTEIGDNAFEGCTNLETLTFEGTTPPTVGTDTFNDCNALNKVVVPVDSLTAYNNSDLSSLGANIVDTTGKGSCGTSATWKYDDTTKTLTISGTGAMTDWTAENPAPWNDKITSIENVVIADGITAVGDNAFDGCSKLATVTFENATPPTIGTSVFDGCTALNKIVVPAASVDAYKGVTNLSGVITKISAPATENPGGDNPDGDNPGSDNPGGDNTSGGNENINPENISKEVQVGENVPKTELTAPAEELVSAVLAAEELSQLTNADKIGIVLEVVENVPTKEDKQSVESFLESSENVLAQYLDVSLFKVVNDSKTQITSTKKPIRITFDVPEELRAANRTFAVLRVHDGETVLLPDLDNDENTVTIETDKFSTYALTYQDKASSDQSIDSDTTGDNNPITGVTAVVPLAAMIAAAALVVAKSRKR